MSEQLRRLIASARQTANDKEAALPIDPQNERERIKRLVDIEAIRQQREWADFAEKGLDK